MEPVRLQPECIECLIHKYLDKAPEGTGREKRLMYMQRFLSILATAPKSDSAPLIMERIDGLFTELFGAPIDFGPIKRRFNALMLEKEGEAAKRIEQADDPLRAAVQFAMTGNYIDFGALDSVSETELTEFLNKAQDIKLDQERFAAFKRDAEAMHHLVYMTDNCGEIVMDKLLLRTLQGINPKAEYTVIVRGAPVINDATREDAEQVGLDKVARVLGSGKNIAGIWLDALPEAAARAVREADVLIAKGQGNFETLNGCGLNLYYLFLCKCDMFARRFGVPRFTGLLTNDRFLPEFN